MATPQLKSVVVVLNQNHNKDAKWLNHYSSTHQILSIGDGDFSFSLCLATAFASASNITATSLDSYDEVIKKYKNGKSNLEKLKKFGARVIHGVDATKMMHNPDLKSCKFDRIVFNFPHAGFHGKEEKKHIIRMHRSLVNGFFKNASRMLRSEERVEFKLYDYPGYINKRGNGPRCDEVFPLGDCSTYKFIISRKSPKKVQPQDAAASKNPWPLSPRHYYYYPEVRIKQFINDTDIQYVESISQESISQCAWIFGEHLFELFGQPGRNVAISLHEDLRQGYDQYMTESTQRTVNGYMYLLCELQRMNILESAWLRMMLGISTPSA